nr:DUF2934 domain-containing protein [Nostoc sp. FACHB-888]
MLILNKNVVLAIKLSVNFISNRPDENKIRLKAYEIWQQTGYSDGKSIEHWLQAEKELIESKI